MIDATDIIADLEEGIYEFSFINGNNQEEIIISGDTITAYINVNLLDGAIAIAAEESHVFDKIHQLTKNINIGFFIVLIIMFLVIQFLIIRYIKGFINTQEALKKEAEDREQNIKELYEKIKYNEETLRVILEVSGEGLWD